MNAPPAIFLILSFSTAAVGLPSNQPAPKPKTIHGSGCIEKAVESSCHVLIDSKTGDTFNLFFSGKVPKPGTAIQFKATAHQGMTTCMQGKAVSVTSWKKEKGIKCPPAPKPAPKH